jgi:type IV pilus assembly protein PilM
VFADSLPMGANTIGILDIGHTMTTWLCKMAKSLYHVFQVFGGKQLTLEIQSRYGLSLEEAGRAKKRCSLPDDYDIEILEPFLDAVVQQAARSLQFFFSSSQFNEIDHILLAGGNANIPGLAKLLQQNSVTESLLPIHFYKWVSLLKSTFKKLKMMLLH